ncbi:MAG: aminoglycoside phosphotransferase family protein [Pseudomonadota bacterium]
MPARPAFPSKWGLRLLEPITHGGPNQLWRAQSTGLGAVVVKAVEADDEMPGVDFLRRLDGCGAVRVFDVSGRLALMEYLPGEALGDMVRGGRDSAATAHLADTVIRMRSCAVSGTGLKPLAAHVDQVFTLGLDAVPREAVEIARALLDSAPEPVPLHGDLHHDNVIWAPRGWLAIDAKGLIGDPACETANAFRNPVGAEALVQAPARILEMADIFAARLGLNRQRLLDWAVAQCAIAMAWSHASGGDSASDKALLPVLMQARAA